MLLQNTNYICILHSVSTIDNHRQIQTSPQINDCLFIILILDIGEHVR